MRQHHRATFSLHSSLESLEPRIAPAAIVFITDLDGDTVAIKTTKGTNEQLTAALRLTGMGLNGTIQEIDFSTVPLVNGVNPFAGTNLTVSVIKQGPNGDGRLHVGYIDASASNGSGTADGVALSLGVVKISGDLGQIDAGVGGTTVAIKSLMVQSIGAWGVGTQGANGSTASSFAGKVGTIKIAGSMIAASFAFDGPVANLAIAGSFIDSSLGGTGDLVKTRIGAGVQNSGFSGNSIGFMEVKGALHANLSFAKDIGTLKVHGDFISGRISAVNLLNIQITGSIYGIDGINESGSIVASGNATKIKLGGDLRGGSANDSGRINVAGNTGSLTIDGSIIGPSPHLSSTPLNFSASFSSTIVSGGNIGSIRIGGDLAGPILPSAQNATTHRALSCSTILVSGDIGSIYIGGSVIGVKGFDSSTTSNTRIVATHIGSITVAGDFTGTAAGTDLPEIYAIGSADRLAIGKLTIGGSLRLATVIAGTTGNFVGAPRNADGQIGTVIIRGDLASATLGALDVGMGVSDNVNVTSRIASLSVGGSITGNSSVRAEHIGSVTIGGIALKLQPGARNETTGFTFLPGNGSVAEFS